ncbi:hypothetical protein JW710_03560 [Candidatus Dojkabacteria bacterium]|nr:hypothetical protein [Candidatus Dojkabacteria bacterium]
MSAEANGTVRDHISGEMGISFGEDYTLSLDEPADGVILSGKAIPDSGGEPSGLFELGFEIVDEPNHGVPCSDRTLVLNGFEWTGIDPGDEACDDIARIYVSDLFRRLMGAMSRSGVDRISVPGRVAIVPGLVCCLRDFQFNTLCIGGSRRDSDKVVDFFETRPIGVEHYAGISPADGFLGFAETVAMYSGERSLTCYPDGCDYGSIVADSVGISAIPRTAMYEGWSFIPQYDFRLTPHYSSYPGLDRGAVEVSVIKWGNDGGDSLVDEVLRVLNGMLQIFPEKGLDLLVFPAHSTYDRRTVELAERLGCEDVALRREDGKEQSFCLVREI